jgi:hypothetical protein
MGLLGDIAGIFKEASPITSVLGDIGSGIFSASQASQAREFNADQSQISRDWQERMANTQYQRTVQDLNAAGLSPMLAYSKGASALPSGATASSGAMAETPQLGATGMRMAQADLAREQVNVAKSQEQVNIASAKSIAEQAKKTALEVEQMPTKFYYELANLGSQINANTAGALASTAGAGKTNQDIKLREPEEKFKTEYPTYSKYASPVRDALDTIFKGIGAGFGALRGSSALPFHSITTKGR